MKMDIVDLSDEVGNGYPRNLQAALLALQTDMPKVAKAANAQYGKYATLDQVTDALLPGMTKVGLSWSTSPKLLEGQFGLLWELEHISGDTRKGFWPIQETDPQKIGSAITYARRYALCAVTGLAPHGDDDDGQGAHRQYQQRAEPQPDPKETERADAEDARRAVAKGLASTDMNFLIATIDWVTHSTIADRDVSGLLTDNDRERLPEDTEYTLLPVLIAARSYLHVNGEPVRAETKAEPDPPATATEEESHADREGAALQAQADEGRDRGSG